jgi:PAS domain S-box-containing protein
VSPRTEKRFLANIDGDSLIDLSPIVHYLATPAGSSYALTFVSAGAEHNTGFSPDRFTSDPDFWPSRVHPDDRVRLVLGRASALARGTYRQEYRFQHANGTWRWVHDEATLIRDAAGAPVTISGAWLDITHRKLAEVSLRQQKEFLDGLIENAPTIVLLLDGQGRIAKVNPYFEKKSGFGADEVIGKDWFDTLLPHADRVRIRALFHEILKRGTISGNVNPIATKNGALLEIEWFAQVLTGPDGRFDGLLCIGHDVTERIEHEKALEASKRDAERATAAKSRFLITASHDLRQPLQTLLLLNSSLRKTAFDSKQERMLEMQSQALKGMSRLLNALLDIGKLESGAIQPQIADIALGEVFQRVQAEFDVQARAKGLEFRVDDCPFAARADVEILTQLLQNVVANAIRYTRAGIVRLGCRCQGDELEIFVEDSGIGIPDDQREAIFDEFYQVDRAGSNGGLGLGLSIVKRLAALLDTRIAVESELGKGSTFSFTLARVERAAAAPPQKPVLEQHGDGGTVLLVDDDQAVLAASQLFLELEGYEVVAAASPGAVDGAITAAAHAIDLVVTDYHLNDRQTGLDIVAAVRQRFGRAVPAILVTGDTSPSVGETQIPELELMSKPIDTNELLTVVRSMISRPSASDSV